MTDVATQEEKKEWNAFFNMAEEVWARAKEIINNNVFWYESWPKLKSELFESIDDLSNFIDKVEYLIVSTLGYGGLGDDFYSKSRKIMSERNRLKNILLPNRECSCCCHNKKEPPNEG